MPIIKVIVQTVQTGEQKQMDEQTNGHYQTYYLPCFVVDNEYKHFKEMNKSNMK